MGDIIINKNKMGDIIMNVDDWVCEPPIIGTSYKDVSSTGLYRLNWTSKGDLYNSYGLVTTMKLYYSGDGGTTAEYTNQPIPMNAVNFQLSDLPGYDTVDFILVFSVENGDLCNYEIPIPYSSIIIT